MMEQSKLPIFDRYKEADIRSNISCSVIDACNMRYGYYSHLTNLNEFGDEIANAVKVNADFAARFGGDLNVTDIVEEYEKCIKQLQRELKESNEAHQKETMECIRLKDALEHEKKVISASECNEKYLGGAVRSLGCQLEELRGSFLKRLFMRSKVDEETLDIYHLSGCSDIVDK